MGKSLCDDGRLPEFHYSIGKQKEAGQTAENAAGPEPAFRNRIFWCIGLRVYFSSIGFSASGGLNAVHHPGNAVAIGEHGEGIGPESFLQGHTDIAAFGKGTEEALGFGDILYT